jgi:hypothetical protein
MSSELETIQASIKRLTENQGQESAARAKALTVAMQGVQTALAELLAMAERKADDETTEAGAMGEAVDRIVAAIKGMRMQAPDVRLEPKITVEAPQVTLEPTINVAAPEVHLAPVFNVPKAQIELALKLDRGETTIKFEFDHTGPFITGGTATIKRR